MYFVYLIRSLKNPSKTYIGYANNVEERLDRHNTGTGPIYTKTHKPWELVSYIAFNKEAKALAFEKYIKVGSGHALAKKRFW
jgi:predicted GIY-YIG superfamily endonuclease